MKKNLRSKDFNSRKENRKNSDDLDEYVSVEKSMKDILVIKDRIRKARKQAKKVEKYIEKCKT